MSAPAPALPPAPAPSVIGPSVTPKAVESYLRAAPPVDEVGAVSPCWFGSLHNYSSYVEKLILAGGLHSLPEVVEHVDLILVNLI